MKKQIEKIAVIGAGVMGAQIAAHFVNARFSVELYDIVAEGVTLEKAAPNPPLAHSPRRNQIVEQGLERARKAKPPAFFLPEWSDRIKIGNLADDFLRIGEADWIIEAVTENLEIKRGLLSRLDEVRKPGSLISSNTSGISLHQLAAGLSEDFRRHWIGTHFFNPPRYMKLLEIIPTSDTDPQVIETVKTIGEERLGKGVVVAKDTPNFIANRIGTFAIQQVLKLMVDEGFTIDEIDLLTGPLIGRPKSATFRTLDIVGIDTYVHVTRNIYQNAPNDEQRELFTLPSSVEQMVERRWLGDKTGQGFYKKAGKDEILSLDIKSMNYGPPPKVSFPALEMIRTIESVPERLKALIHLDDRAGKFIWKTLSAILLYAANRSSEISDDIVNVDNALKWGFNWELGPFEMWDAFGVGDMAQRLHSERRPIPPIVQSVLSMPTRTFYQFTKGAISFFDFAAKEYQELKGTPGTVNLRSRKEQGALIKRNSGASLLDLGDGVACVEFHSKMNSIGADTLQMVEEGLKLVEEEQYGLVIGNQGQHFSAGANLMLILLEAQEQNWEEIDLMIKTFQKVNMAIKYASRPVVVAPFGLTLGGGCEMCLHATQIQAAAEAYIGLVEMGVGLIPAGGGTKEMLLRSLKRARKADEDDCFVHLREAFETTAMAKVSSSAHDARNLGFLSDWDGISMNRDLLIRDAKRAVQARIQSGYQKPAPASNIVALGNRALAPIKIGLHQLRRGGYISEYDYLLGGKLAYVLCGGDCNSLQEVNEQYILNLEREVFLSLCGERKTQERIQYMLKKGKPLRN
jgi:3-hydroxyacyl-CoA dehydrogenase